MWTTKASAPLTDSIQIPISSADRARVKFLAKALSKKEGALCREILLSSLDSISPAQAQELLNDYLMLNPHENGDLWLASEGIDIICVGHIDTDGDYSAPASWRDLDSDDYEGLVEDLREEMAHQIPEEEGWSWVDYPASMLVFAFSPTLSDAAMDALCKVHEAEKIGKCDIGFAEALGYAETVSCYAAGKDPHSGDEAAYEAWQAWAEGCGLAGWKQD